MKSSNTKELETSKNPYEYNGEPTILTPHLTPQKTNEKSTQVVQDEVVKGENPPKKKLHNKSYGRN